MKIAELTTRNAPPLAPGATLQEAAAALGAAGLAVLPVMVGDRLVGTLSDRDLALGGCGGGLDPTHARVSAILGPVPGPGAALCPGDTSLRDALRLMGEQGRAALVVVDGDGRVAGVVSLAGLLDLLGGLLPEEAEGPEPDSVRRVRGG